jgi:hypothetical protein
VTVVNGGGKRDEGSCLTEGPLNLSTEIRQIAANAANAEDADIWRWFSGLVEDRRIRWCLTNGSWLVSIDNRHVATNNNFDDAIRAARLCKGQRDEVARVESPRRRGDGRSKPVAGT